MRSIEDVTIFNGDTEWGSHLCHFYENAADLTDVIVPYLKDGLESNERCIWVTSSPVDDRMAMKSLETAGAGQYLADGQIEVIPDDRWYFLDGQFDSSRVMGQWLDEYDRTMEEGYEGLRVTGNLGGLGDGSWNELVEYEAQINANIHDYRMVVLCSYSTEGMNGRRIPDVMMNHRFSLVRGIDGWRPHVPSETAVVRRALQFRRLGSVIMDTPTEGAIEKRVMRKLSELEKSMHNRERWAAYPVICEVSREIGEEIENWTELKLKELGRGETDTQSFAEELARVHRKISGASRVRVEAGPRSIVMDVEGCDDFEVCRIRREDNPSHGCFPDMIVAAVLQRYLDTPVKMSIESDDRRCRKTFTPAWMVEALRDLDTVGVAGLVLLYRDRVLFSHMPTQAEAEALSESLLLHEENPEYPEEMETKELTHRNRKLVLLRLGDVFMSACLRPGASVQRAQRSISQMMTQTLNTL